MKESELFNTNPIVSTTICSIIGLSLIGDLTAQEQNVLGNWLMLIAQELITNAASQGLIQNKLSNNQVNINSKNIKKAYYPFIYNINELYKVLNGENINQCKSTIDLFKKAINKINEEINKHQN